MRRSVQLVHLIEKAIRDAEWEDPGVERGPGWSEELREFNTTMNDGMMAAQSREDLETLLVVVLEFLRDNFTQEEALRVVTNIRTLPPTSNTVH